MSLATFTLEILVQTPLHVGGKVDALPAWQLVSVNGRTYVLSEQRLARHPKAKEIAGEIIAAVTDGNGRGRPTRLDHVVGADGVPTFAEDCKRYDMAGAVPARPAGAAALRVLPRRSDGAAPYLPGSAVKGALRVAILDAHLRASSAGYAKELTDAVLAPVHDIGAARNHRGREAAKVALQQSGSAFDRRLVRGDIAEGPHGDLLRALKIGDSDPLPMESVEVLEVDWLNADGGRRRRDVFVECIVPETRVVMPVTVDTMLLTAMKMADPDRWAERLIEAAGDHTTGHRAEESDRMKAGLFPGLDLGLTAAANLRIGWGGGLLGTTLAAHVDEVSARRPMLDALYRNTARPGAPAPKTRRVVAGGRWHGAPFGWVTATMSPGGARTT